jgi:hypothetical protein
MSTLIAAASSSSTKPTPFIAWHSLGEAVVASAVFGIGIVLVLSVAIALQASSASESGARRVVSRAGAVLGVLIATGAVAYGIYIMVHKPS